ncbi:hypothetical protein ACI6QG_10300 [Roseococcus sp. DSY-14]|uniref:hypothetical protein n=1 Tax=Roseococcus sp. DSY-14 TaxID=3369650 RepID=UPI00387B0E51
MRSILAAGAATAVLSLATPGTATAQAADTWQFRCPAAGTTVDQSSGTSIRFRAEAPNNPGSCIVAGGQRRLLGYWSVGEAFYRAGGQRIANAVASGLDLRGVQPVTFDYFGTNRTGESIHIQETWGGAAGGSMTTPAGTFDTVRVDREFQVIGSAFRYTQSVWFDRATNVPVAARIEHRNPIQAPSLVNWVATEITRPAMAAR